MNEEYNLEHFPEETYPIPGLEHMSTLRYKPINLLIISDVEGSFNVENIYLCMPTMEIDGFKCGKKKLDIPYYGIENAVVSCNYDNSSRGLRNIKEPLKAMLDIDYQIRGKNQHLKLASKNIHITGVRSMETGEACINEIIKKIVTINDLVRKARSLKMSIKREIVIKIMGEDILGDLDEDEDDMGIDDIDIINRVMKLLIVNYEKRHKTDYSNYLAFLHFTLFGTGLLYESEPKVSSFNVHNMVHYVDSNFSIDIYKVNVLSNFFKHTVVFDNTISVNYTKIIIKSRISENVNVTFDIKSCGGIFIFRKRCIDDVFDAIHQLMEYLKYAYIGVRMVKNKYSQKTYKDML